MNLGETIRTYSESVGEHHRYRSWDHCYGYFQAAGPERILAEPCEGALQLAFYLASWGMYRGSSFLLQYAYTVHVPVVRLITQTRFQDLWRMDVGADGAHKVRIPALLDLVEEVRGVYRPFALQNGSRNPTDTLVTKVLLGTLGCVPACDRFFLSGLKKHGLPYSVVNAGFFERMIDFCQEHHAVLRDEQNRLKARTGLHYPLMKLVDMYFWESGFEAESAQPA